MRRTTKLVAVVTALILVLNFLPMTAAASGASFTTQSASVGNGETVDYWLFTPANAQEDMPLIIYLHGMSQKGDDIDKLAENGLCKWVYEGTFDDVPAYMVFPQLSASYQGWKDVMPQIKSLIESIVDEYDIDADNISLTGHSMGGIGTYAIANEYPDLFSAIAPLSGSIVMSDAVVSNLSDLPLWAFVAAEDRYVNPNASISLAKALWEEGANAQVTVLNGATHFTVPELVYLDEDTDILGWLIREDKPMAEQAVTTVGESVSGGDENNTESDTSSGSQRPGSGGRPTGNKNPSSSAREINISAVSNGTVSTDPSKAKEGTVVTITVTPDEGYVLDTLTVTDEDGNELEITDEGDDEYSFEMPGDEVTIEANFVLVNEECIGGYDCPAMNYTDVDIGSWYHESVDYVLKYGLMNGVGSGKFDPYGTTTRAMIVTILWRLEGEPVYGQSNSGTFSDVAEDTWYTDAVEWAAANGIVTGYDGKFAPNDAIIREQFAAILWRYAQYKGYDVSIGGNTNIFIYEDACDISEYAVSAMQWACGSGLMQGDGSNLTPKVNATRCQSAALLMRFCELDK